MQPIEIQIYIFTTSHDHNQKEQRKGGAGVWRRKSWLGVVLSKAICLTLGGWLDLYFRCTSMPTCEYFFVSDHTRQTPRRPLLYKPEQLMIALVLDLGRQPAARRRKKEQKKKKPPLCWHKIYVSGFSVCVPRNVLARNSCRSCALVA